MEAVVYAVVVQCTSDKHTTGVTDCTVCVFTDVRSFAFRTTPVMLAAAAAVCVHEQQYPNLQYAMVARWLKSLMVCSRINCARVTGMCMQSKQQQQAVASRLIQAMVTAQQQLQQMVSYSCQRAVSQTKR
jgi:hypothetical protein